MINFPIAAVFLLLLCSPSSAIVIQLNARGEECFFVATESRSGATCQVAWQTQLGATLEIDVDIHDPRESLVYSAIQEPEGQTAFVAAEGGRYRVCFSNVNNGQYPKFVAFRIKCTEIPDELELAVTPPPRRDGDTAQRQNPISYHLLPHLAQKESVTDLTTDLSVLDLQLLNIVTEQRLFHSKLKAHRQIVDHTHETVLLWRTVMCVSVALATLFQMWHVRRLFEQKMLQLQKQPPSGNNSSGNNVVGSSSSSSSASSSGNEAASSVAGSSAAAGVTNGSAQTTTTLTSSTSTTNNAQR